MNNRLWTLVVLVFTTALLGEMKINPFDNFFRFSLGSAIFFFGLLSFRSAPILVTGFSTGIFVLLFRMMIDLILGASLLDRQFLYPFTSCLLLF